MTTNLNNNDKSSKTICYTCFRSEDDLISVCSSFRETKRDIKEILATCTSTKAISIEASLCKDCINKLETYYDFFNQCQNSDKIRNDETTTIEFIDAKLEVYDDILQNIKPQEDSTLDSFNGNLYSVKDEPNISGKRHLRSNDDNLQQIQTEAVTNSEKKFKCAHCDKSYSTKYYKTKHEKIHSLPELSNDLDNKEIVNLEKEKIQKKCKEKQYKCKHCDHLFAYIKAKKTHERMHVIKNKNRVKKRVSTKKKKAKHTISLLKKEVKLSKDKTQVLANNNAEDVKVDVEDDKVDAEDDKVNVEDDKVDVDKVDIEDSTVLKDDCPVSCDNDDNKVNDNTKESMWAFKCEHCDKTFNENAPYYDHLRKEHNKFQRSKVKDTKRTFLCTMCGKTFNNRPTLTVHIRVHTGEKPFHCKYCPKKFVSFGSLAPHIRTHTGEKRYACNYCDMRFTHAANRNQHLKIHTGNRSHVCDVCKKGFYRAHELRDHMRKHTGEKPFQCEICNKMFTNKRVLKRHFFVHVEGKPHVCTVCGKGFAQIYLLKRHLPIHMELQIDTPYLCNICGKRFRDSYFLKRHIKSHENKKEKMLKKKLKEDIRVKEDLLLNH